MLKFILVIHGFILIYVYGKSPSWTEASSIVLSSETVKRFFLMAAKLLKLLHIFYERLRSADTTMPRYRIIGINHDDLADGSGKAGLTFETTNDVLYKHIWNDAKDQCRRLEVL